MVKGLSIMTLFFLHFENGWMNYEYNYFIVRSPAFYIVVGWLWGMSSNKKTIKGHWTKRKEGLVKPYIWLSIIFLCFDAMMVILKQYDFTILGRDLFKTLSLKGIGTLWFLPALLGGEMLFIYLKDKSTVTKVLSYLTCTTYIISTNDLAKAIYTNNQTLDFVSKSLLEIIYDISNAYIYISIAYHISRKLGKTLFKQKRSFLFISGIVLLIASFYSMNYKQIFLFSLPIFFEIHLLLFAYTCSGIGVLLLFKSLEHFRPLSVPLAYCGKNSLTIMAFHFCLLFPITLIFDKNILGHSHYYGDITIIYFLVAVILQIGIIELVNRKFPYIIGKSKN